MKPVFLGFLLLFSALQIFAQTSPKVKFSDLDVLKGEVLTGTATIHNQDAGTKETIPVQLTVIQVLNEKNTWDFSYEYPGKTENNETESIKIISGGRYLNDQQVVARSVSETGIVKIITEEADDNRFYVYRYLIGPESFNLKVVEKINDETFLPIKVIDLKR